MVFTVRATIEVIGYPEDHVKEVMQKIIEKLKTEDGLQILKNEVHPTEKVKEKFFATFVDIEMKINDFGKVLHFCYDYLPSSFEIIDADKITIPTREFSAGISEMIVKLHQYNLIVNNLSNKITELQKK